MDMESETLEGEIKKDRDLKKKDTERKYICMFLIYQRKYNEREERIIE